MSSITVMFHPYFTAETQGTRRYLLAKNKTGRIQMGASGIMKIAAVGRADIQSCKKGTFCFSPMRKAECPLFIPAPILPLTSSLYGIVAGM
jgi:hypothetical protein